MRKTVEEVSIANNKKASVIKLSYTDEIEVKNDIKNNIFDNIAETQYKKFISLFFNRNTQSTTSSENLQTLTEISEDIVNATENLPEIYLAAYKELIKLFFKATGNSVYKKSAQELGTTFSGASLLKNTDFFKLIDVQSVKDAINKKIQNDPCMALDPESNLQLHPLKIEMIKEAFLLSARTHVVDYFLRNIFLTSVFNNVSFYEKDSSYADFLFQSYVQRIQAYPKYYDSLIFHLQIHLDKMLSNGTNFIDPITNKAIQFPVPLPETKQEIQVVVEKYMRYLINEQIINVANTFNSFFNRSIKQNNVTINLSPNFNIDEYILDNLNIIASGAQAAAQISAQPLGSFFFFLETVNNINNAFFCIKKTQTTYKKLISLGRIDQNNQNAEFLKRTLKTTQEYDLLFNYCLNPNKALNFASIYNILLCSKLYEKTNMAFEPCIIAAQRIHNNILSDTDGEQKLECEDIDLNFQFGLNAEILKIIPQTAVQIVKSIEETYDPNIVIAKLIKDGAEALGTPDLSIIPYSAPLMLPQPIGLSLFPSRLGYVYWGISAAEAILNASNTDVQTETSGSFEIKNPFKPNC